MGVGVDQLQVSGPRWRGLVEALRVDLDLIADRSVARLRTLPSYRPVPAAELRPGVLCVLRLLVGDLLQPSARFLDGAGSDTGAAGAAAGLVTGRPADHEEHRDVFARLGELRARQGVTVADLIRGWRGSCDEVVQRAREVLPPGPESDRLVIRLYDRALTMMDAGMAVSADAHQRADAERSRAERHARATLVRALLVDKRPPAELAGPVDGLIEQFRLDRTAGYHAVRARPGQGPGAGAGAIERYLAQPGADPRRRVVLALIDGDVCGFTDRLPTEPAPVPVGVSGPVGLHELGVAFGRATRLLEAALALGRAGLIDVPELGVHAAVVADTDVGEAMLDRYVRPLLSLGPAGELILDTVSRFLGNDARLDTTARELHVHVNTVRYRLGRFEQVTGCSLRSVDTVVEVWWALRRRSLGGARTGPR
jgi:hypothetical protein